MKLIIGSIALFGIGWFLNELTDISAIAVGIGCFVAVVGILVLDGRKLGKK